MISHEYMYFFTGCIYLEITMKATQVVKIGLINKSKNIQDRQRDKAFDSHELLLGTHSIVREHIL